VQRDGLARADQVAQGTAVQVVQRRHADPGRVAGPGECHVELAQVFAQALGIGLLGGPRTLVGAAAQGQVGTALGVVPAQHRLVGFTGRWWVAKG